MWYVIFLVLADVVPVVTINASKTNPDEKSSITLRCVVTGSPKPQRSWEIGGVVFRCVDLYQPCIYHIDSVEYEKHNGVFTCTAKNLAGENSKSLTIEVQGTETLNVQFNSFLFAFHL